MNVPTASCDFCGLPIRSGWGAGNRVGETSRDSPAGPQAADYCCVGCRIAATVTRERGETGAARWMLVRLGLSLFLTLNVLAFSMALWTRDVYAADVSSELAQTLEALLRYLCLLFSIPVLFLLGLPLAEGAWQALRRRSLSTDLLLVTGVCAAYLYSTVSVVRDAGPIYFEVGCVILVMVTLGRWLEATGKLQAGAALEEMARLLPSEVRVSRTEGESIVPLDAVQIGDRLRVLPGERFPTDGRLLSDALHADEQLITGESVPVVKTPGELLCGGTLNLDAEALMEATARPCDGTLARLMALMREARQTRGETQRLADRLAAWVFPVMALVAVGAGVWHGRQAGVDRGLLVALSVVLVTCPCALGLATPLAVWSALGLAARRQVLFRSGEAFERLASIRAIRFDKTGTLTTGRPRVTQLIVDSETSHEGVSLRGAQLARSSSHPYSKAIVRFAGPLLAGSSMAHRVPIGVRQVAGLGLADRRPDDAEGSTFLGNARWMNEMGLAWSPVLTRAAREAEAKGEPLALVGWGAKVRGLFVFSEELRPGVGEAIAWCQKAGLDVALLTGDHHERGRALAKRLGVPVLAGLTPEEKVAAIRATHDALGPVAMVGDGVNDAPALAASDVGIALGCGADVSRDSAAVCLLGDDLARLTWGIEFARRGVRTIRRNLIWAFVYNGVGVALAVSGRLNPAIAALLMVVSSLLVIGHALRLGRDEGLEGEERALRSDRREADQPEAALISEPSSSHASSEVTASPVAPSAAIGGVPT